MSSAPVLVKGSGQGLGEPAAILLLQLGDIGDVVLTTPCIRSLRTRFPRARLEVAVRDKAAALLADCPWLDGIIPVRKARGGWLGELAGQLDLARALRRPGFQVAIDLRTGTRGAILAWLSGASRRLGFYADSEPGWRNHLFTDLLRHDYTPDLHVTDHLLGLLEGFGIPISHRSPELVVGPGSRAGADRLLAEITPGDGPLVAVQPFSLWRYKEWGTEKYVALIRWLLAERCATVLVTGGPAEQARAEAIARECGSGCHNLAGRTSLSLYAALLQQCRLFIGVDSAGLHIAAAVGTPTVSLFGPSSAVSWAPVGPGHRVVQKDFPCLPCREKGCGNSEKSRCLDELSVAEVTAAVAGQLDAWETATIQS
ncbi:MAG: glycosyltransferase family 9 protein [Thermodesulfobacteriota bacterium]